MSRVLIALVVSLAVIVVAPAVGAKADTALGCFARVYDRAHLASHPDQIITTVRLSIKKPDLRSSYAYDFALSARVRGRDVPLNTGGLCVRELGGVKCTVECDGGGVDIKPHAGHAMMYLDRIRVAKCGEELFEGGEELSGGKDDRVFRLDRMDDRVCVGMKP